MLNNNSNNNSFSNNELQTNQQERINTLVQTENYKFWLGGFVEGEGTLVISITKSSKTTNGIILQPEFNVAQHENGLSILYSFKALFNNQGSVHRKSGSDKVWVYSLKGIQNIKELVLPFYLLYVLPYSSKYKSNFYTNFSQIANTLYECRKTTMSKEVLKDLVRVAYTLNPDGKGKQRKRGLEEILDIIDSK
jgi:hypothetical protein